VDTAELPLAFREGGVLGNLVTVPPVVCLIAPVAIMSRSCIENGFGLGLDVGVTCGSGSMLCEAIALGRGLSMTVNCSRWIRLSLSECALGLRLNQSLIRLDLFVKLRLFPCDKQ
jgi:hypothetical protein